MSRRGDSEWPSRVAAGPPAWVEPTTVSLPEIRAGGGGPAPIEGFLDVLRVALVAGRVAVWRRDGETWRLERETADARSEPLPERALPAGGHPFTWAVKEGLQLQVQTRELFGSGGGWSLVGGPAGPGRVLCLSFEATPPAPGRPALGAALRHLRALHRAEAGRERGPVSPPPSR